MRRGRWATACPRSLRAAAREMIREREKHRVKRILFINPAYKESLHSNIKVLAIPPLNLAMIAAYTPDHYEIEIVDEAVEHLDLDAKADLVGITCMTPLAPRAYELATHFRNRGIPVVMGGIHASYMWE